MRLIGLAGLARSGKDSVAHHLVQKHGFHQIAFADPIKGMLADYCRVTPQYMNVLKECPIPPHGATCRRLMQLIGDAGRTAHNDFWVMLLELHLQEFADYHDSIVVSDIRYGNEARWVRSRGQLWHITRPAEYREEVHPHSSEQGIVPLAGEAIITIDGTLHDLLAHVDRVLA
jgi:dephospho-CoA kinase